MDKEENQDHKLDEIEEELIKEDQKKRKTPMLVAGRSVFELKRIKDTKKK